MQGPFKLEMVSAKYFFFVTTIEICVSSSIQAKEICANDVIEPFFQVSKKVQQFYDQKGSNASWEWYRLVVGGRRKSDSYSHGKEESTRNIGMDVRKMTAPVRYMSENDFVFCNAF